MKQSADVGGEHRFAASANLINTNAETGEHLLDRKASCRVGASSVQPRLNERQTEGRWNVLNQLYNTAYLRWRDENFDGIEVIALLGKVILRIDVLVVEREKNEDHTFIKGGQRRWT